MKKILSLILCLIILVCFSGCHSDYKENYKQSSAKRFIIVESLGSEYHIIVDKTTGVCYLHRHIQGGDGITVMLDADGKPLLYNLDEE